MTHIVIVRKCLILFCLTVVLSACSAKTLEKLFPQITPQEQEEVKSICNNLKAPPFFVKVRQTDIMKSPGSSRSIEYSSYAKPEQVEEYYVNLLKQAGWSYYKEDQGDADYLRFKKDKYGIGVQLPHFSISANRWYGVSCSIRK